MGKPVNLNMFGTLDEEVENATQNLLSVMEPVIILVIAVFVGLLVGACVMPMLSLYKGLDNL